MAFVQYEEAFDLLQGRLAEISAGCGQLVVVRGGPASGKTKLLHEFAGLVTAGGATFLGASGSRDETGLPAGVLDQLFHSAGLPSGVAERVWDRLASSADEAQTAREICAIILDLAKDRPLVIGVDDVQYADAQSRRLLLYLQRRLGWARILLVVTEWDRSQPTDLLFGSEITRRPHDRLHLARLTRLGVAELVERSVVDPAEAGRLAPEVHRLSGGNAMLVQALLEDYLNSGDAERCEPVVGPAFRHAVLSCLHRWDNQTLDVARAVAVLGDLSQPTELSLLTGVDGKDVEQVLAILTEAGILTAGRVRHPAVRDAVLGGMSACERATAHLDVAEMLHRRGASAMDVADHIISAGCVPDGWGVGLLRAAAEQALATDRVQLALRCLKLAFTACVDEQTKLTITAMLARASWRLNPAAAAPYVPALRTALQEGKLSGRDAVVLIRCALWNGDDEEIADVLRAAHDSAALSDPLIEAELRLAHHLIYGSGRNHFPPSDRPAAGDPWSQAVAAVETVWTEGANDAASASAEQIVRSYCLGDNTLGIVSSALLALAYGNRLDKATEWCDSLVDEATRRGASTWLAVFSNIRAEVALRCGDLAAAKANAETALRVLPPQNWGMVVGYPVSVLVSALTRTGRHQEAAEVLNSVVVPESMFSTLGGLRYLQARGHHLLATDRALAAIRDFRDAGAQAEKWGLDVPALVSWRSDVAEASLKLKRVSEARDLLSQQLEPGRCVDLRTKGISLRLLALATEPAHRPALLKQAINALHTSGDRYELARALSDLSAVQKHLGEVELSRQTASRAEQVAKACRAVTPTGSVGATSRQRTAPHPTTPVMHAPDARPVTLTPRGDEGAQVLSNAEQRVAMLAARGHSNREIARTLYITVSTVEQHLTRVYRKLNANNRGDLASVLTAQGVS
ncbi:helix-turn-helix transcriptional regulator [Saccharothrix luteola]|uniref:helix-turn-helix transcriptional regulator n=1 Tax=Saccharothrix luteola TaxID=2893018 RepID=UPI001E3BA953|nr:LuxR family transcriptional regulator [Saccharothrix luteola]MCC8245591.1 LuxR C-terminal-related transcriptional regulator [Saccharothrix luteola]